MHTKEKDYRREEQAWCSSTTISKPRRIPQISSDIRDLIIRSNLPALDGTKKPLLNDLEGGALNSARQMKALRSMLSTNANVNNPKLASTFGGFSNIGLGIGDGGSVSQNLNQNQSKSFDSISSALGFTHHEGSDRSLELKVIKCIMMRENVLMKLTHLCEIATGKQSAFKNAYGTAVLDYMMQLRNATVEYLTALTKWRESIRNEDPAAPTAFIWEGDNYTLKIVRDIDFLAYIPELVEELRLTPEKMLANPLMLSDTLENSNVWIEPSDKAGTDCGGVYEGNLYEERLVLRKAERVLLLEIECHLSTGMEKDTWDFATNSFVVEEKQGNIRTNPTSFNNNNSSMIPPHAPKFNMEMITWPLEADLQLRKIEALQGETLNGSKSTKRMEKLQPSDEDDGKPGTPKYSHKLQFDLEPTKLTALDSSLMPSIDPLATLRPGDGTPNANRSPNQRRTPSASPPTSRGKGGGNGGTKKEKDKRNEELLGAFPVGIKGVPGNIDSTTSFYEEFANADEINDFNEGIDGIGSGYNLGPELPEFHGPGLDFLTLDDEFYDENETFTNEDEYLHRHDGDEIHFVSKEMNRGTTEQISMFDIEVIVGVPSPSKSLLLLGAICIIVLSGPEDLPEDITWEAFKTLAARENIAHLMNNIDPTLIPKFKIRALKPFLLQLDSLLQGISSNMPSHLSPVETATFKLTRWVGQIMIANETSAKNMPSRLKKSREPEPLPPKAVKNRANMAAKIKKRTKAHARSLGTPITGTDITVGTESRKGVGSASPQSRIKTLVPKVSMQLWPIHTEILEHVFKHPLLLTLLGSRSKGGEDLIAPPKHTNYDPLQLLLSSDVPDRLVVKIYDLVESKEATVPINVREYTLLLYELRQKYSPAAVDHFNPGSINWWISNLALIVSVKSHKAKGSISVSISKKAIDRIVGIGLGAIEPNVTPEGNQYPTVANTSNENSGDVGKQSLGVPVEGASATEWGWGLADDVGAFDSYKEPLANSMVDVGFTPKPDNVKTDDDGPKESTQTTKRSKADNQDNVKGKRGYGKMSSNTRNDGRVMHTTGPLDADAECQPSSDDNLIPRKKIQSNKATTASTKKSKAGSRGKSKPETLQLTPTPNATQDILESRHQGSDTNTEMEEGKSQEGFPDNSTAPAVAIEQKRVLTEEEELEAELAGIDDGPSASQLAYIQSLSRQITPHTPQDGSTSANPKMFGMDPSDDPDLLAVMEANMRSYNNTGENNKNATCEELKGKSSKPSSRNNLRGGDPASKKPSSRGGGEGGQRNTGMGSKSPSRGSVKKVEKVETKPNSKESNSVSPTIDFKSKDTKVGGVSSESIESTAYDEDDFETAWWKEDSPENPTAPAVAIEQKRVLTEEEELEAELAGIDDGPSASQLAYIQSLSRQITPHTPQDGSTSANPKMFGMDPSDDPDLLAVMEANMRSYNNTGENNKNATCEELKGKSSKPSSRNNLRGGDPASKKPSSRGGGEGGQRNTGMGSKSPSRGSVKKVEKVETKPNSKESNSVSPTIDFKSKDTKVGGVSSESIESTAYDEDDFETAWWKEDSPENPTAPAVAIEQKRVLTEEEELEAELAGIDDGPSASQLAYIQSLSRQITPHTPQDGSTSANPKMFGMDPSDDPDLLAVMEANMRSYNNTGENNKNATCEELKGKSSKPSSRNNLRGGDPASKKPSSRGGGEGGQRNTGMGSKSPSRGSVKKVEKVETKADSNENDSDATTLKLSETPPVVQPNKSPVLSREKEEDDELAIYEDVDDDIGLDDELEAAIALKPPSNSKGTNSASSVAAVAQKTEEGSEEVTSQTNWEDLLNDDFLEDPSVGDEDRSMVGADFQDSEVRSEK